MDEDEEYEYSKKEALKEINKETLHLLESINVAIDNKFIDYNDIRPVFLQLRHLESKTRTNS